MGRSLSSRLNHETMRDAGCATGLGSELAACDRDSPRHRLTDAVRRAPEASLDELSNGS